jgi:hypothetical protein
MKSLAPRSDKQVCASCKGGQIKRTTLTSFVVYFRCQVCGWIWSIPERRVFPRPTDPQRF